jgi:hypothetical protein
MSDEMVVMRMKARRDGVAIVQCGRFSYMRRKDKSRYCITEVLRTGPSSERTFQILKRITKLFRNV